MSDPRAGIEVRDLAYAAALVDTLAVLRLRQVGSSELPLVAIHGTYTAALGWLATRTGTKVTRTARDYYRGSCASHCPEPHVHVVSTSGRWSVTGARATILLHNLLPYLRVQEAEARSLVASGLAVGYSGSTVNAMARLGWDLPPLRAQSRARVQLDVDDDGFGREEEADGVELG